MSQTPTMSQTPMRSIEETIDIDIDTSPLCPELRAHGQPSGVPILVGGETWLLAHGGIASVLDPFRDRMDDQCRLSDQVNMVDVFEVGLILLRGNYELTTEEVIGLLQGADSKALVAAVMAAVFGDPKPHRTYTIWAMSSLYGAGLDPDKIPAEWIPHVLQSLVMTGRAVPISQFTDAAMAAPRLKALRARAGQKAAEEKALAEAAEEVTMAAPALEASA
jgi:hypothetical protein